MSATAAVGLAVLSAACGCIDYDQLGDRYDASGEAAVAVFDLATSSLTATPDHALTSGGSSVRVRGPWSDCTSVAVTIGGAAVVSPVCDPMTGALTAVAPAHTVGKVEITASASGVLYAAPFRYYAATATFYAETVVSLSDLDDGGVGTPSDVSLVPRGKGGDVLVTLQAPQANGPCLAFVPWSGRTGGQPSGLSLAVADCRQSSVVPLDLGLALVTVAIGAVVVSLPSDGGYRPSTVATGYPLWSLAVAHFDPTATFDILALQADSANGEIVRLRYPSLSMEPIRVVASANEPIAHSLAVADFNGDGTLDVASVSINPTDGGATFSQISLTFSDVAGNLLPGAKTIYTAAGAIGWIVPGDVNGDGYVDLAVGDFGPHVVTVLPGLAKGGFGNPVTLMEGQFSQPVAIGDLNGDGWPDLASTANDQAGINVWLAAGTPWPAGVAPLTTIFAAAPAAGRRPIAIVDVDGDGLNDLVVANQGPPPGVGVFFNSTPQP